MAEPVIEARIQQFKDLEDLAKAGDVGAIQTLFFALSDIVRELTKWQWVIHGDTVVYRQRCVRWLMREKRYKTARRFALCGRGDVGMIASEGDGVRIRPKGCGCRFCPRCSRRYGRRFLSRVAAHLSSKPHGPLHHIVLTQRVRGEESLEEARKRFELSWKLFYPKLRKAGMMSALATYHVTASSVKGWHYHCHVLVEFEDGVEEADWYPVLDAAWNAALGDPENFRKPLFNRGICNAGGPMVGLAGDRQMEFWAESRDPVEVVLQYVLRDVLQGVEGWIGKLATDVQAEQFAGALACAKLHRLYGEWRKKAAGEDEADKEKVAADEAVAKESGTVMKSAIFWHVVGNMDEVLHWAKTGKTECVDMVRRLLARGSNRGAAASRLCRLGLGVAC